MTAHRGVPYGTGMVKTGDRVFRTKVGGEWMPAGSGLMRAVCVGPGEGSPHHSPLATVVTKSILAAFLTSLGPRGATGGRSGDPLAATERQWSSRVAPRSDDCLLFEYPFFTKVSERVGIAEVGGVGFVWLFCFWVQPCTCRGAYLFFPCVSPW